MAVVRIYDVVSSQETLSLTRGHCTLNLEDVADFVPNSLRSWRLRSENFTFKDNTTSYAGYVPKTF